MDVGLCSFISWEGINDIRSKMNTIKGIEYERNKEKKKCNVFSVVRRDFETSKSKVFFYHQIKPLESENYNELESSFLIQINHDK